MSLVESTQKLKIGDKAPEFELSGTDGKMHRLDDYTDGNALVLVFMCNHCPYVLAKLEVLKKLHSTYSPKKVSFVAINSNNNPDYPDDSYEKMKEFAHGHNLKFDYLFDETQDVAKAYGATCTPDPFVFDADSRLVYHGRFDDARTPEAKPTTHELADALDAVVVGSLPRSSFLPSMGCSIKWRD
ncbi:MAG: thioredoxin family protein [Candidatus Micrarchaeota archaeon]